MSRAIVRTPLLAQQETAKYRNVFESVAMLIPARERTNVMIDLLSDYVHDLVLKESTGPKALRKVLELKGLNVLAKLLRNNRDSLADASTIVEKFGIAASTLHRKRGEGSIIAYRPNESIDFLYPMEQFENGAVRDWAKTVVDAVGNGGAAIHLLYVPRVDVRNRNVADLLRETPEVGARYLSGVLKSLTEE